MKHLFLISLLSILLGCSTNPAQSRRAKIAKADILLYFYKLYPKDSNMPIADLQIDESFAKEGYIKVTGNAKNYYVYNLFNSYATDYMVEQNTECKLTCTQSFKVHLFQDNELTKSRLFTDFYAKKDMSSHLAMMKKTLKSETLQPWIKLPKVGTSLEVLLLDKTSAYHVGYLAWNNETFDYKPLKTPATISITDVQ